MLARSSGGIKRKCGLYGLLKLPVQKRKVENTGIGTFAACDPLSGRPTRPSNQKPLGSIAADGFRNLAARDLN
jgi:hypothetical protein